MTDHIENEDVIDLINDADELAGAMILSMVQTILEMPQFKRHNPNVFLPAVLGNMYAAAQDTSVDMDFCQDCVKKAFKLAMNVKTKDCKARRTGELITDIMTTSDDDLSGNDTLN